jgi:hypothetical protein
MLLLQPELPPHSTDVPLVSVESTRTLSTGTSGRPVLGILDVAQLSPSASAQVVPKFTVL